MDNEIVVTKTSRESLINKLIDLNSKRSDLLNIQLMQKFNNTAKPFERNGNWKIPAIPSLINQISLHNATLGSF